MSKFSDDTKKNWLYGSTLPFAEAAWARGCPSPYYRDSHRRLRDAMRTWVETVRNSFGLLNGSVLIYTIESYALFSGMGPSRYAA